MSPSVITILIGWLLALAIFFGFIVLLRYLAHRERIEMIRRGIEPTVHPRQRRHGGMLRAGLITGMVGFTLTIGLYPIGFILPTLFSSIPLHLGPWLLPGLIPLGVGLALIISYYLERDMPPSEPKHNEENGKNGNERFIHPHQDTYID